MAIYLDYEGIKGSVTAEGYQGHIDISSFGYRVARKISMEAGSLANRESSHPTVSAVTLLKKFDSSSISLLKESLSGSVGKMAVIKFVRTGEDQVQEYMDYTLEDCLVSRYAITASIYAEPAEVVMLSFSKIILNFKGRDAMNKSASPLRVGYDLTTATPL